MSGTPISEDENIEDGSAKTENPSIPTDFLAIQPG